MGQAHCKLALCFTLDIDLSVFPLVQVGICQCALNALSEHQYKNMSLPLEPVLCIPLKNR